MQKELSLNEDRLERAARVAERLADAHTDIALFYDRLKLAFRSATDLAVVEHAMLHELERAGAAHLQEANSRLVGEFVLNVIARMLCLADDAELVGELPPEPAEDEEILPL